MPNAYVFTAHGGPEVESFADLPRPAPGPAQLLVAVHAAGVNPAVDGIANPFVTATFPLGRAPEGLWLVEEGHARGKIVIEVA
jgi:NADPH:quinone reductase-like Zn-dependent oxidoreductase